MLGVGSGTTLVDLVIGGANKGLSDALGDSFIKSEPVTTTLHVFLTLVVFAIIAVLAVRASKNFKARLDKKLNARTFFEIILDAVMGLMEDQMGKENARRFLPLIGTLALFIFISNVLAVIPGMAPPTDNLNTTVAPALIVFFTTHYVGLKENGMEHIKHLLGPIRAWYALPLMLLIFAIEVIGHIVRPVSLSLRLFGNMTADHTVLAKFLDLAPFIVPLPNMMLGCIVVIVQTLVFCLLSVIYIALALPHEDDHH